MNNLMSLPPKVGGLITFATSPLLQCVFGGWLQDGGWAAASGNEVMWKFRGVPDARGPRRSRGAFVPCRQAGAGRYLIEWFSGRPTEGAPRHPATARNGAVPEEHWLQVAAGGASKAGPSCGRSLAWCDDAFCCERAYSDCGLCSSMSVRGGASSREFREWPWGRCHAHGGSLQYAAAALSRPGCCTAVAWSPAS